MNVSLNRRPSWHLLPDPVVELPDIAIGTCVRVSLVGAHAASALIEEGVVIEVVPPYGSAHAARVLPFGRMGSRSRLTRYVVQCWDHRLLRSAYEMLVVVP